MPAVQVLLVEDELGIRMTVEDRFRAEGLEIVSAADGIRGQELAMSGDFDVIILDIMLPRRDGLAVCKNLRDLGIQTPIIMLTARNTNLDVVIGLRQGADDYLAKPFDLDVLIARCQALLRRGSPAKAHGRIHIRDTLTFGDFVFDGGRGQLRDRTGEVQLNSQEYRLLEFFLANQGRLIGREEILDKVWGYESNTTTRTVDVHVAKLRQRLGESELPRHIITIRGRGYKFEP